MLIVITGSVILLARKPEIRGGEGAAAPLSNDVVILPARGSSALPNDALTPATPPPPEVVDLMPPMTTIVIPPRKKNPPVKKEPVVVAPVAPPPLTPKPVVPLPPPPRPPLALLVNPRGLAFTSPGWAPVTITNPNAEAIHIDRVAIAGAKVGAYRLDAKECDGITLQPKESCRVTVTATPAAVLLNQKITIEVAASRPE